MKDFVSLMSPRVGRRVESVHVSNDRLVTEQQISRPRLLVILPVEAGFVVGRSFGKQAADQSAQ